MCNKTVVTEADKKRADEAKAPAQEFDEKTAAAMKASLGDLMEV